MAVRRPLKWNGSSIVELTDEEILEVVHRTCYRYGLNPSVTLSHKNGGNLSGMSDTRLRAGASVISAGDGVANTYDYTPDNDVPGVSVGSVGWDKINQNISTVDDTELVDGDKITYPVYYNNGNIQAMTKTDFFDTFIHPAIDILTVSGTSTLQGGTYTVFTSAGVNGYTRIGDLIMYDTRANASKYSSAGVPESIDQPKLINTYYLHRTQTAAATCGIMLHATANGDLQQYSENVQDTLLTTGVRWSATSSTEGYKIRYSINGSGANRGTAIKDTRLNSSTIGRREIGVDDYRSQRFPAGSATTISTYRLRIRKE